MLAREQAQLTFIFLTTWQRIFFVCICYLRHTASYRSMGIGPGEIYKRVMSIIQNEEPSIKAEVRNLFGNSYQEQEFDTKFKELWESNWESTRKEVHADENVFINSENTWADEQKNKSWGSDCRRKAAEHRDDHISETARTNIDILKGKIIADFQKLAKRKLKLEPSPFPAYIPGPHAAAAAGKLPRIIDSRVGNPLQGRGVLGGRNRYMV